MNDAYQKIIMIMLSVMIGVSGWFGKNLHDSTTLNSKRLTVLESTVMDKYESGKRIAILEHRINEIESEIDKM